MTHDTKRSRRIAPLAAATLAAFLLAGCSSDHIGETWQCPLAAGGSCNSVAAADPTVPDPKAAGRTVLDEPLWRVRERAPDAPAETVCTAGCGGGFAPFAWLARLFGAEADEGEARPAGEPAEAPAAPTNLALPVEPETVEPNPATDDLRTREVVGRIWIAPFVDADGVYREASHVRVVLEPVRWRLR